MNVNLHIERLVLLGMPLAPGGGAQARAAVAAELARLLASGGLSDALRPGGALGRVRTSRLVGASDGTPAQLGEWTAGAIYGVIGS
jgi:hypothetical protein